MSNLPNRNKCILTTSYLPNIWFFIQVVHYDGVWLESKEHYQKRSFRNRCIISGPNAPVLLSVPLAKGKNAQLAIGDVKMVFHESWQSQHWNSIQTAYGKTPFFEHYKDAIHEMVINREYVSLFDFNLYLIKGLMQLIHFSKMLHLTNDYERIVAPDFIDLRDQNPFLTDQNIDTLGGLIYPQPFDYKQPFRPNLSILDLLFCKGPETPLLLEQAASRIFE